MNIKSITSTAKWLLKYKNAGIPYDKKNDPNYITWYLKYKDRLAGLANIHEGEDCFIIGNGPSINKMNLELLNRHYVFGLNKIFLIFEKVPLDLTYLVAVNKLVIEQSKDEYREKIQCPIFLPYTKSRDIPDGKNIYKLWTRANWSFYDDLTKPISEGFTVTYVAMQIAYYMGFKNVYLVGVDHNFVQTGKSNEEQKLVGDDPNHFHPDYFKGQKWHLADLEGNEASYALAKHQFHKDGREIYDATLGGKLAVYKKISFEEALDMAKPKKAINQ